MTGSRGSGQGVSEGQGYTAWGKKVFKQSGCVGPDGLVEEAVGEVGGIS